MTEGRAKRRWNILMTAIVHLPENTKSDYGQNPTVQRVKSSGM